VRPPAKLRIGGMVWTVSIDPEVQDDGEAGTTVPFSQRIKLAPGQGPDYERDTLLHEVLHAVLFATNLRKMEGFGTQHEESVVLAMSPILLQVLRDNPRLLTYLTERT
jgi:hypothetical protein